MKAPHLIIIVAALGISLGLGYSLYEKQAADSLPLGFSSDENSATLDNIPDFSYPDLQGNIRSSQEWSNKIVVLNYWATWCPPCKKEIPDFIAVQKDYSDNVQFVGLALDDRDKVKTFADEFGINYPTLLADMAAIQTSKKLGNRFSGLPFTAIFDQHGRLKFQKTGELSRSELEKQLEALM